MSVGGAILGALRVVLGADTAAFEQGFGGASKKLGDFAKMAESMGVGSSGPISDPKELGAAIRRGIDVVKRGEPYLIDVVTQPR